MNGPSQSLLRHPLVLPFYVPALILAFSQGLLVPILPIYAKSLQVSYGLVGLVLAGQALGMLVGDIPAGMMVRRLNLKGTMLLGMGCAVLSTMALFWAQSLVLVFLCRLVTGFGLALWNVSRHAYIVDAVTVTSRGRAIALFGGMMRVGRFVGPMVGGTVGVSFGLRAPFLLFGAAGIAALTVVAFAVRSLGSTSPGTPAQGVSGRNHLLTVLKDQYRVLASAGAGQLLVQMIRAGRGAIIPLYAADVVGLDVQAIGFIESISSAVDMSLFYPAGMIMDRWGRKYAIVPSFLIQALGMSLMPFTGGFVGLMLVATVIGLGNGLSSGSMMTLGADLAPRDTKGEFLGIWRLIGDAGHSGGPLAVGGIADWVALPTAAWLLCAVGLTAAAVFGLLVPETLSQRRRAVGVSSAEVGRGLGAGSND